VNTHFVGAFIGDGGTVFVPLLGKSGWFRGPHAPNDLSTLGENTEDGVWLAPGYGIKLWDGEHHLFPPPDTFKPHKEFKNLGDDGWKWCNLLNSNTMDYYEVYQLK
jgi:hypothetical protein